jgi:Ca2+:H+ antiporter
VSYLSKLDRIILAVVVVTTALAGVGHYAKWAPLLAFSLATVSLAGLAHIVSVGVEQVGERLGAGIAGFMQATLGNLPELFLVVFALREGEAVVAQSTVIGSIFSNALLVLGLVIVVGSRVAGDGVMRFRHRLANDTATLLIATTFIIVIVGLSLATHDPASTHVKTVSTIAAIALLIVYLFWVVPYIRSDMAGGEAPDAAAAAEAGSLAGRDPGGVALVGGRGGDGHDVVAVGARAGVATAEQSGVPGSGGGGGPAASAEEEGHGRRVPLQVSVALLAFGGVGAAFVSDWFVTALAPTVDQLGISRAFAGLVIAAIAGNAVENITAVILATKGQADLAISVVKNSVGQMAAFMWPALVLISLPLSTRLTFSLAPVYIGALLVTALAMWQITGDGEAVAFEGLALIAIYLTLAGVTLYE